MTIINIVKDDKSYYLKAEGHAGYAEKGKDIVCAGISTLLLTLIRYCEKRSISCNSHGESGNLEIYIPNAKEMQETLKYVEVGLCSIAEEYPDNLLIKWGTN